VGGVETGGVETGAVSVGAAGSTSPGSGPGNSAGAGAPAEYSNGRPGSRSGKPSSEGGAPAAACHAASSGSLIGSETPACLTHRHPDDRASLCGGRSVEQRDPPTSDNVTPGGVRWVGHAHNRLPTVTALRRALDEKLVRGLFGAGRDQPGHSRDRHQLRVPGSPRSSPVPTSAVTSRCPAGSAAAAVPPGPIRGETMPPVASDECPLNTGPAFSVNSGHPIHPW